MLIDTHCHLDFASFAADRAEVLARATAAHVTHIIVPGLDLANCTAILPLTVQFSMLYAAVGIHPNSTATWQDNWLETLRHLAQHEKVVAIGEIGLDYYWDNSPKALQQHAFAAQLELAAALALPVIIHNREASADLIAALRRSPLAGQENAGVLHSFSGDWLTAVAALDMGFYLGFTGPLTYKKADELRQIAAMAPLERLLIETDAPFLTPQPRRGQRNEPAYVAYVAEKLAEVRGVETTVIAHHTTQNALRLFCKMGVREPLAVSC